MQLVFLPGVSGAGSFWAPAAHHLPAGHQTRFVDWPGLGAIPPSPSVSSFGDLADLVVAQLDRPSVLVAQSMGGVVAVDIALRHPAVVAGLILCATSGGVDMAAFGAESWHDSHRRRWPDAPGWVFDRPPDLTAALRTIAVPTLLLWATHDPISPLAIGTHLRELIPDATLWTTNTDNHAFAAESPDLIAEQIVAFLDHLGRR